MTPDEIHAAVGRYKFYHNIRLTDEITTPGNHSPVPAQEMCLRHLESIDLKGKRVHKHPTGIKKTLAGLGLNLPFSRDEN
jgi:hypothetical protein